MNKILSLIILFCGIAFNSISAQNELLTAETLWKLGRVNLEDVSPDGKWTVFSVVNYNIADNKSNINLYLVATDGSIAPRKLTNYDGAENNARFRPDGQKINFLMNGLLYEMNVDGSDQNKISEIEMNGFTWSPKGDRIIFLQDVKHRPTTAEVYPDLPKANARLYSDLMYRHWKSFDDGYDSNVFMVSYKDGQLTGAPVNIVNQAYEAPTEPNDGIEQVSVSNNGRYIAYSIKKSQGKEYALSTNSDIMLYDIETGKTKNVSEFNGGYDKSPVFSPDGSKLIFNSMLTAGYEADKNRLTMYDLISGTIKDLGKDYDNDMNEAAWSYDGKSIYFTSAVNGCVQLMNMDAVSMKIKQVTNGIHDITAFRPSQTSLIATKISMTQPAEIYRIDPTTGSFMALSHINQKIWDKIKPASVKSKWVRTTDNKQMLVWTIYPPDFDPSKKYPTLLYCQGGPQSTVSQFFSYRWNFSLMAAKGYIVVAPCRRGMPGFGQEWNLQISKDWGGQCMKDYLSAIDDATRESYVDKDRLGAVGASFGGYSVYYLAGNHNKRFKCFIAHCGMFNMESWYGTTEEMWFANYDIGGAYWDKRYMKAYEKFSPHKFVDNWDTPILILHGEKDYRVPLSEGLQAYQAAQLKGVPSRMVLFPEEGHWIMTPQNSLLWQREFYGWLDKWLKK
ncbi:MAG: S9 family peptidase [Saprospiraceae bacterium]